MEIILTFKSLANSCFVHAKLLHVCRYQHVKEFNIGRYVHIHICKSYILQLDLYWKKLSENTIFGYAVGYRVAWVIDLYNIYLWIKKKTAGNDNLHRIYLVQFQVRFQSWFPQSCFFLYQAHQVCALHIMFLPFGQVTGIFCHLLFCLWTDYIESQLAFRKSSFSSFLNLGRSLGTKKKVFQPPFLLLVHDDKNLPIYWCIVML